MFPTVASPLKANKEGMNVLYDIKHILTLIYKYCKKISFSIVYVLNDILFKFGIKSPKFEVLILLTFT